MNNLNEIPNKLPVNGHDRFEYLLKYFSSNIQIQAVITFNQCLDTDSLKNAVRLSLDAEPVLGCKFIEDKKQPYWQRFESPDEIQWYDFVQNDNKEEAVEQFLKSPFALEGQQVNVRLIRAMDGDTLCVKISHGCSDAAGLKEYLQLLATIYSKLQEDSVFKLDRIFKEEETRSIILMLWAFRNHWRFLTPRLKSCLLPGHFLIMVLRIRKCI